MNFCLFSFCGAGLVVRGRGVIVGDVFCAIFGIFVVIVFVVVFYFFRF